MRASIDRRPVGVDQTSVIGYHPTIEQRVAPISNPRRGMRMVTRPPLELPSPLADFTGRGRELKSLLDGIRSGGVTISALRGLGGIGKTALALKLSELLKPQFPDGQLYVNLMGFGGGKPLTATQAQARVINSFDPEAKIPYDPGAVGNLYQSTLSGRRALLLMDNALNAEQVEPLIPPLGPPPLPNTPDGSRGIVQVQPTPAGAVVPPGSILIVTSRNKFTLPGLFPTDLDALRVEDTRALLLKIAPRIGALADEIARLCSRLPLALRAAASLIAETPRLEISEYVTRLGNERSQLGSLRTENPGLDVQASITISYDLLDPRSRQVLRDLSVFPGSFDRAAAMAVCGEREGRQFDGLVRKSLVEFDAEANRYHLHDLVRQLARSASTEQEGEMAARKHAVHFLAVVQECDRLYQQAGDGVLAGLRLFDLEWTNIQEGQAWAERRSDDDDQAARFCSGYPDSGRHILLLRQHPHDRIRWVLPALAAAQKLKDRGMEGSHLGNLGLAYHYLGNYRRAIELHEQRLAIARETRDRRAEGKALGNLGLAYHSLGEYRRAIEFYEQDLAVACETRDRQGEAATLWNLSLALDRIGDRAQAILRAQASLKIKEEIEDPGAAKIREQLAQWSVSPTGS
jgi:tetratricopeptide (TPR) repeat protein